MSAATNISIGTRELEAWQPTPGVTWVQTRLPEHANRLAKRSDARLVVRGMAGEFLKTFEFRHPLSWAEQLIRRYTCRNHTANAGQNLLASPVARRKSKTVSRQRGQIQDASGTLEAREP
jgi:hypothetical protein